LPNAVKTKPKAKLSIPKKASMTAFPGATLIRCLLVKRKISSEEPLPIFMIYQRCFCYSALEKRIEKAHILPLLLIITP
jgi:hypothetical protein